MTTKALFLDAALIMARNGLSNVSLRGVAAMVGKDHRTVIYYFGTIGGLREAVALEALKRRDAAVIARLIMDKHPAAMTLPGVERANYLTIAAG